MYSDRVVDMLVVKYLVSIVLGLHNVLLIKFCLTFMVSFARSSPGLQLQVSRCRGGNVFADHLHTHHDSLTSCPISFVGLVSPCFPFWSRVVTRFSCSQFLQSV